MNTVTAGATATVQEAVGTAQGGATVQQPATDMTAAAVPATAPRSIDTKSLSPPARPVTRPAAGTVRTLRTTVGKAKSIAAAVAPRAVKRVHLDRKPIEPTTDRPAQKPAEKPPVRSDAAGSGQIPSKGSSAQGPSARADGPAQTAHAGATAIQPVPTGTSTVDLSGFSRATASPVQRRLDSNGAPAGNAPARDAPGPAPPVVLPALAGTASSGTVLMIGLLGLLAIFILAVPGMGRATRLRAPPWRPLGFASPLEQPG